MACLWLSAPAQADSAARLVLRIEGMHFFQDNEFSAERIDGYTLPGFFARPRVAWRADSHLTLEAGFHWLHYWGARRYPATAAYDILPLHSDTATLLHVMPWMQARLTLADGVQLTLGCLDADDLHSLPLPLYNPEHAFASDPEAGVGLKVDWPWLKADVWTDWRQMIFRRSPWQEHIVSGVTARAPLPLGKGWTLAPVGYAVVRHEGGEGLADTLAAVQTCSNYGGGLRLGREWGRHSLTAEGSALGYCGPDRPQMPFRRGFALYASAAYAYNRRLAAELSWWHADSFVPLLGSAHYSNISANTPDLHFDPFDVLTLRLQAVAARGWWGRLLLRGEWVHYFPYTGDRDDPAYPAKVIRGSADNLGFGILLCLNPQFTLLP